MDRIRLRALARRTRKIYDMNAAKFDNRRTRVLFERSWLERFGELAVQGGRVLDVGCGTGDPITSWLRSRGFSVTGVDFSQAMLDIARRRYPKGDWRVADMRWLDLRETFMGAIAWDSFFHLTPEEQRICLPRLAEHLKAGAPLMITVGPGAGEVVGNVGSEAVYHSSLDIEEYEAILASCSVEILRFVREDPQCDRHTVLLARKRPGRISSGAVPGRRLKSTDQVMAGESGDR